MRRSHANSAALDFEPPVGVLHDGIGKCLAFFLEDVRGQRLEPCRRSWTGTVRWRMIGPLSYALSTKWTVQPLTLTPDRITASWTFEP